MYTSNTVQERIQGKSGQVSTVDSKYANNTDSITTKSHN